MESPMTDKYGIEDTMDVITYVQGLADEIYMAMSDGDLDVSEVLSAIMSTAPTALNAFVGASNIDEELKDLSEDERKKVLTASLRVIQTFGRIFSSKDPRKTTE